MLSFQEKFVLANGSIILYHEGTLATGEPFHLLTIVQGSKLKPYLEFIKSSQNFRITDLEKWAKIIRCSTGSLDKDEICRIIKDSNF